MDYLSASEDEEDTPMVRPDVDVGPPPPPAPRDLKEFMEAARAANAALRRAQEAHLAAGGCDEGTQELLSTLRVAAISANSCLEEAMRDLPPPSTPMPRSAPPSGLPRLRPPSWLSWGTPSPRDHHGFSPSQTPIVLDTPGRPSPSVSRLMRNEYSVLHAFLFLGLCAILTLLTLQPNLPLTFSDYFSSAATTDSSSGSGSGGSGSATPSRGPVPAVSKDDPSQWSTGQCRWSQWPGEVFNVTSRIYPVVRAKPWSYGNAYLPSGERLFAVRHVLDSWTDNFARFVVSRTNNLDVHDNPYVLTEFNWPLVDTLVKQGAYNTTAQAVFFYADTLMDDAFAHYVGETAVYFPLFLAVQRQFPAAKLVLRDPKGYKAALLEQYGIGPESVIHGPPFPQPCNNLVFFPPLILYNQWDTDVGAVARLWGTQAEFLRAKAGLSRCSADPGRYTRPQGGPRLLLLPRGSKENYERAEKEDAEEGGAGRRNFTEEDKVFHRAERELGGVPYSTDTSPGLSHQVRAVDGADVILVLYGSAMFFNEALARNATVVVLGNMRHHLIMETFKVIHQYAERFNTVVIFPLPYTAEEVLAELKRALVYGSGGVRGGCSEEGGGWR